MSFQESFRGEKRSKDNPLVNDPIAGWKIQHFDISMAFHGYVSLPEGTWMSQEASKWLVNGL